ncbi:hypothetical protein Syun_008044 [Stephania yunnanensis]|uniref:Cotton fiber protein n=1 Tax=Stephania yunnanensis TaxID=152371 RepID=A0AAP0L105_9MAGN
MDETAIVTINGGNLDHLHHQHQRRPTKTRTRTSPFNIIRAALFMLRRPSSASKSPARIASKPFWKSLVVAIPSRKLNLRSHYYPSLLRQGLSIAIKIAFMLRLRICKSSTRVVVNKIDDDDDDYGQDNINGDEMIDSKAEDFIAHFYAQMRLQRLESMERYNAKNSIKIN